MAFKAYVDAWSGAALETDSRGKLTVGQTVDLVTDSKDTPRDMESKVGRGVPQLSNEMQLQIMNKVKNKEMSIEDALNQAMCQYRTAEDVSQYNFSVYKFNRYRWQKRILQIDLSTKMICSIEKGTVKRQLPFSWIKSCDDGVGTKFSIVFRGRHDYELEAASMEDKHRIMGLVNKIIHGNIYDIPVHSGLETYEQPTTPKCVHEGQLYLQRGGLASFKWARFAVQLHEAQLTLLPSRRAGGPAEGEPPLIIHFSDGNASVEKPRSFDSFTLLTTKNEYQFRVPVTEENRSTEAVQKVRDDWVEVIEKLCLKWRLQVQSESSNVYEIIKPIAFQAKAEEDRGSLRNTSSPTVTKGEPLMKQELQEKEEQLEQMEMRRKEEPQEKQEPEEQEKTQEQKELQIKQEPQELNVLQEQGRTEDDHSFSPPISPLSLLAHVTTCVTPPKPPRTQPPPSALVLPPPMVPAPPPLPKLNARPITTRTKAFHWDPVAPERLGKSLWARRSLVNMPIDTEYLFKQFGVQGLGLPGGSESSNNMQIMLNQKIAHNFSIFLKSFPVKPEELKDKLLLVNEEDGGLSDEHITSLRRYVPTLDDVEMYKSYKGSSTDLHLVDKYMMEMSDIPHLSTRLDLLLTVRELPTSMDDLQPLVTQMMRMCTQLLNCNPLVSVLENLLAIGNYLNENAGKEKAKGFRLMSLTKLSQLRGKERNFTLMHALVQQVRLHDPHVATFFQELAEFETLPGASIKGLTAEVDVLKNELQKVIQYRKTYKKKNQGAQHQKFLKDLKAAIEKHNADLTQLMKRCDDMKKIYSDILVKFGEPSEQDSEELFSWVSAFICEYKRVYIEVTR